MSGINESSRNVAVNSWCGIHAKNDDVSVAVTVSGATICSDYNILPSVVVAVGAVDIPRTVWVGGVHFLVLIAVPVNVVFTRGGNAGPSGNDNCDHYDDNEDSDDDSSDWQSDWGSTQLSRTYRVRHRGAACHHCTHTTHRETDFTYYGTILRFQH